MVRSGSPRSRRRGARSQRDHRAPSQLAGPATPRSASRPRRLLGSAGVGGRGCVRTNRPHGRRAGIAGRPRAPTRGAESPRGARFGGVPCRLERCHRASRGASQRGRRAAPPLTFCREPSDRGRVKERSPLRAPPEMTRKPGSMYREIRGQAYARKEYMGGVPGIRISQFDIGDPRTKFPVKIHLVAAEACQIRHIALEAARISANRYIAKKAGNAYHLKLRLYPHNVLRENKIATGAGADRISEGMRAAFGAPVGTAARVKPGTKVFTISTTEDHVDDAKEALRKGGVKLPTPWRLEIEREKER